MPRSSRFLTLLSLAASSLSIAACVAAPPDEADEPTVLPEGTGAITAKLDLVPLDVRCVEIRTDDWRRTPIVRTDVIPGEAATLRVAPLTPGYRTISGVAYDVSCAQLAGTSGPATDAGWHDAGPSPNPTWEAQEVYVYVGSGKSSSTRLLFRRPGSVDIDIDFDDGRCDPFGWCEGPDGGPPPPWDGGGPHPDQDGGPAPWDGGEPDADLDGGPAPLDGQVDPDADQDGGPAPSDGGRPRTDAGRPKR
jgi:hypothetical protein